MNDKLFNKMRPQTLADVKGHSVVVEKVKRWFRNDTIPSFLLMHGCRGCGKTTVARIIAKVANCEHPTENGPCGECDSCKAAMLGVNQDILELDAASKNKVEDVKALVEKLGYVPFYKRKVVILDEVHRLSATAFDSLLKTLEEPPENVIFIFCTTELQKIPDTIVSRARKLEFSALPVSVIKERLAEICKKFEKPYEDAALIAIAKASRGAMRDAINYLEDFFEIGITEENALSELGLANELQVIQIIEGICEGDYKKAVFGFRSVQKKGAKLISFIDSMISVCIDLLQAKEEGMVKNIDGTDCYREEIARVSGMHSMLKLSEICHSFSDIRPLGLEPIQIEGMVISLLVEDSSIVLLEKKVASLETLLNNQSAIRPAETNIAKTLDTPVLPSINDAEIPFEDTEEVFGEAVETVETRKPVTESTLESADPDEFIPVDDLEDVSLSAADVAALFEQDANMEPVEEFEEMRKEMEEPEEDLAETETSECDNCPYEEQCEGECLKDRIEKARGEGDKKPETSDAEVTENTAEDVGDFFSSLARLF